MCVMNEKYPLPTVERRICNSNPTRIAKRMIQEGEEAWYRLAGELYDAQAEDFLRQLEEGPGESGYGEPQAYLDLPNSRTLEVTHEEYGLPKEQQFYSWRVNCSDKEYEHDAYHCTCGVIDQSYSDDIDLDTCSLMLQWAYRVARLS